MHGKTFAAIAALIGAGSSQLAAQQPAYHPSASVLFTPPTSAPPAAEPTETYWKTGALVVGIPSAVFGGAVGVGLCGLNDSAGRKSCVGPALGMGLLFGVIGGTVGALIGGQFHKDG